MGTYNLSIDEFERELEKFLEGLEGEVEACTMMSAWNRLAKKNGWKDRIMSVTSR